jgi:hypothetical protein
MAGDLIIPHEEGIVISEKIRVNPSAVDIIKTALSYAVFSLNNF